MDTVFEPSSNREIEIVDPKNKIKELEEKIKWLESEVKEKTETISVIENNMEQFYVENWIVSDQDGEKGEFSGNIYWIKGEGTMFYKDNKMFEGSWDSKGEIIDGELRGTYSDELLAKWEDGEEVDLDEDY